MSSEILPFPLFANRRPVGEDSLVLLHVHQYFDCHPEASVADFGEIARIIGLPFYIKKAIFDASCQCSLRLLSKTSTLQFQDFLNYWNKMIREAHDEASRFVFTLSVARSGLPATKYVVKEDIYAVVLDIIHSHPSFEKFQTFQQFEDLYIRTVITQIFWKVSCTWSGKITPSEVRNSTLLATLKHLEGKDALESINFFSYQEFYVTYSLFWMLDNDHDMFITKENMQDYNDGLLTNAVIDRIFSPAVTRSSKKNQSGPQSNQFGTTEIIGYEEFVAFLLAEEDKRIPKSIEYWFRVLDLDGDGIISIYEMEQFYHEVAAKLSMKGFETLQFKDVVNQVFDMVNPKDGQIRLSDLKRCKLAHKFFNIFINVDKYVKQESASFLEFGIVEKSDWEKFCAEQYKDFCEVAYEEDGKMEEN